MQAEDREQEIIKRMKYEFSQEMGLVIGSQEPIENKKNNKK